MKASFSVIAEKVCKLLDAEPLLLYAASGDAVFGVCNDPASANRSSYICSFLYSESDHPANRAQIHAADECEVPLLREEAIKSGSSLLVLPKTEDKDTVLSAAYRAF